MATSADRATDTSNSIPTPPISADLVRWMESLLDTQVWSYTQNSSIEQAAMEAQFRAGRLSILSEIKTLYALQHED